MINGQINIKVHYMFLIKSFRGCLKSQSYFNTVKCDNQGWREAGASGWVLDSCRAGAGTIALLQWLPITFFIDNSIRRLATFIKVTIRTDQILSTANKHNKNLFWSFLNNLYIHC